MKTKLIDKVTLKFFLVGIVNTVLGTGTMFILYNVFKCGYFISSASNYVVGSISSYFLNKYFTFKNAKRSAKQIVLFIVNIVICYTVAYGLAKPFVYWLVSNLNSSLKDNIAMLAGSGIFIILNYLSQRFIVFKK